MPSRSLLICGCLAALMCAMVTAQTLPPSPPQNGYTFVEDQASYYNVSRESAKMVELMAVDQPDWTAIQTQYSASPTSGRRANALALRTRPGELFYETGKAYWNSDIFMDSIMGAAINGTDTANAKFSDACCGVRLAFARTYYLYLYITWYGGHEIDAGHNRTKFADGLRAAAEVDNFAAMWFGRPGAEPKVAPWDLANSVGRSLCTLQDGVAVANMRMVELLNGLQAAAKAVDLPKYEDLRGQMFKALAVPFVQASWRAARQASSPALLLNVGSGETCATSCPRSKVLQAEALAYWNIAAPLLATKASDQTKAVAAALAQDRTAPSVLSMGGLRRLYVAATEPLGINWQQDINACTRRLAPGALFGQGAGGNLMNLFNGFVAGVNDVLTG